MALDGQQVCTLLAHDGSAPHEVAQTALVQDDDVLRAVVFKEAALSTQAGPYALLDFVAVHHPREQCPRVALCL